MYIQSIGSYKNMVTLVCYSPKQLKCHIYTDLIFVFVLWNLFGRFSIHSSAYVLDSYKSMEIFCRILDKNYLFFVFSIRCNSNQTLFAPKRTPTRTFKHAVVQILEIAFRSDLKNDLFLFGQ